MMNRRKLTQSLLAAAAVAVTHSARAGSLEPTQRAFKLAKRQAGRMHRQRKVIRGEPRNSATAPSGSFARTESDGLLFLTNGFGFQHQIPPDSYIEWHLQQTASQMKFKCVNSDQYRVKAFPCAVLGTMGGRYETIGNPAPVAGLENEFRMKGEGLQSPLFDLIPAQKQCGFPCFISELPHTDITVSTTYAGNPTVNTFLDMYLHDVDNPRTASHPSLLGTTNAMNSNRTKAYNINVWFRKPDQSNGGSNRPDRGWAGGKVIGDATISGHAFHVILKIETGGGNYFRYIALVPKKNSIDTLNINQVMEWAQTDLRPILQASREAKQMMAKPDPRGFKAPRWPDKRMVLSGLHIGNEIWWSDPSGQEGIVNWDTLRIDVDGFGTFGWGEKKSASLNPDLQDNAGLQENISLQNNKELLAATPPAEPEKKRSLLSRLLDKAF